MDGMDEMEVAQAQIVDVPSTFDGSVVLLDVREDDEWRRGHAPGAQHIPMGQVPSRSERRTHLNHVAPRVRPIISPLACAGSSDQPSGDRSDDARTAVVGDHRTAGT